MAEKYRCVKPRCKNEPAIKLKDEWLCTPHWEEHCNKEAKKDAKDI